MIIWELIFPSCETQIYPKIAVYPNVNIATCSTFSFSESNPCLIRTFFFTRNITLIISCLYMCKISINLKYGIYGFTQHSKSHIFMFCLKYDCVTLTKPNCFTKYCKRLVFMFHFEYESIIYYSGIFCLSIIGKNWINVEISNEGCCILINQIFCSSFQRMINIFEQMQKICVNSSVANAA